MEKVVVAGPIAPDGIVLLRKSSYDIKVYSQDANQDEILAEVKDSVGIISLLTQKIDRQVMDNAPVLKVISNYAVGFDNIDLSEAASRKIYVTNTPGVLTDATAELAITLILAAARRIGEAERYCRAGLFKKWDTSLFLGTDIHHKTLGIIGAGNIGQEVARKMLGFSMEVLYTDAEKRTDFEKVTGAAMVNLDELLARSDFISVNVPYNPGTHHLINKETLSKMKKTAIIVNTSRGKVINEKELCEALESGVIRAAGIDVYENEPKIYPDLLNLDNVVLLPHIGSATTETRNAMSRLAANNLLTALSGSVPENWINPW